MRGTDMRCEALASSLCTTQDSRLRPPEMKGLRVSVVRTARGLAIACIPSGPEPDSSIGLTGKDFEPICLHLEVSLQRTAPQSAGREKNASDNAGSLLCGLIVQALERGCGNSDPFVHHLAVALCFLRRIDNLYATQSDSPHGGLRKWQQDIAVSTLRTGAIEGGKAIALAAAACGLSESHFGKAFKHSIGVPPHQWILLQRLEHAQHLLADRSRSLAEIAVDCGFCDQSHMNHVFQKVLGLSPGAWRFRHCAPKAVS